jgi:hypothetical protein
MNQPPIAFFREKITSLRLSAQLVYDSGMSKGLSPAEVYDAIRPITETMEEFIRQAVKADLAGVVFAVKSLQNEANAHNQDAKYLIEKEMNTRNHIDKIEQEIRAELDRLGVHTLTDGDFSVVSVAQDGRAVLTYR